VSVQRQSVDLIVVISHRPIRPVQKENKTLNTDSRIREETEKKNKKKRRAAVREARFEALLLWSLRCGDDREPTRNSVFLLNPPRSLLFVPKNTLRYCVIFLPNDMRNDVSSHRWG